MAKYNKNYLTYPCKVMRITQSYTGKTSHLPHTTGNPKDYPWDEGCKDGGREAFYCPCDELKIMRLYTKGTNTIWVQSTSKVVCPNGKEGIFSALITHPNDSDFKKLTVGKKFKRGDLICYEGKDGATGNHLHISAGLGALTDNGWTQNSKGKWVLTTEGKTYKPEQLFYIDPEFTKVIDSKGLKFKELPKNAKKTKKESFFPKKGYFEDGDVHKNIGKIAEFMYEVFPKYTKKAVLGNTYGPNLKKAITTFQENSDLVPDGLCGPLTLAELEKHGFTW